MSNLVSIDAAPIIALRCLGTSRSVTIVGSQWAEQLKHYLLFQFVRKERRAQLLCADNRIDVLLLARMARRAGLDDEELLRSVEISRAFTAYQMCELVLRLDESLVGQLVILSDPCALFIDDDLKPIEAARHFYRMLWHITALASRGVKFLITHRPVDNSSRAYLGRDLLRISEIVMHLSTGAGVIIEHHDLPKLPRRKALPSARGVVTTTAAPSVAGVSFAREQNGQI